MKCERRSNGRPKATRLPKPGITSEHELRRVRRRAAFVYGAKARLYKGRESLQFIDVEKLMASRYSEQYLLDAAHAGWKAAACVFVEADSYAFPCFERDLLGLQAEVFDDSIRSYRERARREGD